jgi:dynein heavy chain 1
MHQEVRTLNKNLMKSAKKFNYITPRDFLDFIRHFIAVYNQKKQELVEQQSHLNSGLDKIKDSEEEVKKLQAQLKVYQEQLVV